MSILCLLQNDDSSRKICVHKLHKKKIERKEKLELKEKMTNKIKRMNLTVEWLWNVIVML